MSQIRNDEAVRKIAMKVVGIDVHAASISPDELRQHVFDEARSRRFQDHDFNADEAPIIISPVNFRSAGRRGNAVAAVSSP